MAVSVRASFSMPHLHSMDFDLAPKNRYGQDIRWGNSSPVLILSLLEIVEKDSIHMQEAAPRLRPGWVRNACAAFEQGVPLSSIAESQSSGGNCQEERPRVDLLRTKEPPPRRSTSERDVKTTRGRLSKAKSLDSLLTSQVTSPAPKRHGVANPRDLQRHSSFSLSSTSTQKVDLQAIRMKLKSPDARNRSFSKPLASPRPHGNAVKTSSPKGGESPSWVEQRISAERVQVGHAGSDRPHGQREFEAPGTLPEQDGHAIAVAKLELGKSIAPMAPVSAGGSGPSSGCVGVVPVPSDTVVHTGSCATSEAAANSSVDGVPSSSPVDAQLGLLTKLEKDPNQSCDQSFPDVEVAALDDSQRLGVDSDSEAQDNLPEYQGSQSERELPSITSPTTVGESSRGVLEVGEEETSVTPKLECSVAGETLEPSCEDIERLTDGAFSECIIQNDTRPTSVSVTSSYAERGSHLKEGLGSSGNTENVVDQSAMDNRVIALRVEGASCIENHETVVDNSEDRGRVREVSFRACSARLADRWRFPLDKLEMFLLVKDAFQLGASSLRWGNCQFRFISHRELLAVPRLRFSNVYPAGLPRLLERRSVELEGVTIDHISDLKVALARKWSRTSALVERRKAKLKAAKVGLFRYQLLTHPLTYFDASEVEDSGSDSEAEDGDCDTFTYFSLVPTYIIANIFRFLNTRDLAALKCTCVDFHWLINQFDVTGRDCLWNTGVEYRSDPCMHCGRIRDPRGDVSLCRRHPKMYYSYSHIGRQYWTCCNAGDRRAVGCQVGLHDNRWTTAQFEPNFICKPWKSRAWFVTANHELWCDKEHL